MPYLRFCAEAFCVSRPLGDACAYSFFLNLVRTGLNNGGGGRGEWGFGGKCLYRCYYWLLWDWAHRCVKEKRKRQEGQDEILCAAVVIFSWEREECWDSATGLKQMKRTTATNTTKRKRNLGWTALKRQTEECLFCVLIIYKCQMRASSCSVEFKSLMSWNLKSVTEGFSCLDRWWSTVLKICLYQSPETFCFSWRTCKY